MTGVEIGGLVLVVVGLVLFVIVFLDERRRTSGGGVEAQASDPVSEFIKLIAEMVRKLGPAYIPPIVLILIGAFLLWGPDIGGGGNNPDVSPTPTATASG